LWVARAFTFPSLDTIAKNVSAKLHSIGDTLPTPPDFDLLRFAKESLKDLGEKGFEFLDAKLKDEIAKHPEAIELYNEFKDALEGLIKESEAFSIGQQSVLEKRGINFEALKGALTDEFEKVIKVIESEFSEPLPEDQEDWYKELDNTISRILDQIEDALVTAYATVGHLVPEFEVRAAFRRLKPHIKRVILTAARFCRRHPILCAIIVTTAVVLIGKVVLPRVLKLLLRLTGFGARGPIKGSLAARLQSFIFGPLIPAGSWFSCLQRLAMVPF